MKHSLVQTITRTMVLSVVLPFLLLGLLVLGIHAYTSYQMTLRNLIATTQLQADALSAELGKLTGVSNLFATDTALLSALDTPRAVDAFAHTRRYHAVMGKLHAEIGILPAQGELLRTSPLLSVEHAQVQNHVPTTTHSLTWMDGTSFGDGTALYGVRPLIYHATPAGTLLLRLPTHELRKLLSSLGEVHQTLWLTNPQGQPLATLSAFENSPPPPHT